MKGTKSITKLIFSVPTNGPEMTGPLQDAIDVLASDTTLKSLEIRKASVGHLLFLNALLPKLEKHSHPDELRIKSVEVPSGLCRLVESTRSRHYS
jgi:hypothetical protein